MSNPAAFFDLLFLAERMSDLVEGFSHPELHLLAYASCLLSLYEGHPFAEWEYEFISAPNGLPFSQDLDAAIDSALELGQLRTQEALMLLTESGVEELRILSEFESNKIRARYLAGAADCLLVFTPGSVREAFNYDPAIKYLRNGNHTEWLLTPPVVDRIYLNFNQLRDALAYEAQDLSVPLVSWLKYLIQTGRPNFNDSHTIQP